MREPAEIVEELEREAGLPPGSDERFAGYGVMGLPFRSGHVRDSSIPQRGMFVVGNAMFTEAAP